MITVADNVLEMRNITKVYGNGILANNGANFSLKPKEIHALMGENGAGKSTLMNVLFGFEKADEGEIFIEGKKVEIKDSAHALEMGIGMIHQHFMLVPSFTVTENIILGEEPKKGTFIDEKMAHQKVKDLIEKYNFNIDPNEQVRNLPIGKQQQVEILKALYRGAKILILDEPTAVLAPQETELLFKQLLKLKEQGHTLIFISHKIREIIAICDRITIMQSGKDVGVYQVHTETENGTETLSEEQISSLMIGRDVVLSVNKKPINRKEEILRVENLYHINTFEKVKLNDVSFSIRKGEILGVAGVEGNGQAELVKILTKIEELNVGSVKVDGIDLEEIKQEQLRADYISYIPSDRIKEGVAISSSIEDNLIPFLVNAPNASNFIKKDQFKKISDEVIKKFSVKCESKEQKVGMLSGGNMQKVVVGREISNVMKDVPKLIIAEQPSRGIDIGSTKFIHNELVRLREEDLGILLISADLNELLEVSDSIIVMFNGEITAYFKDSSKIDEALLGRYMLGLDKQSPEEIREALYVKETKTK